MAGAIVKAAKETGIPDGVFSSLNGGHEVGNALVTHPYIKAVSFTGSFGGGTANQKAAQNREEPVLVYAEMGSINPVLLLEEKLSDSVEDLAEEYAGSVSLGVGQFCTNPGLFIDKEGSGLDRFKDTLSEKLKENPLGCMLNSRISEGYRKQRAKMFAQAGIEPLVEPDEEDKTRGSAAVATTTADNFLSNEVLQDEVFGPYTLIVSCRDEEQIRQVTSRLEGQLTITLMGNDEELTQNKELVNIAREKAGRVIFNGVPTGVRVSDVMHHGGPFPATTDAKYTSVGTAAIERFVHPIAFQDSPQELLPDQLKDDNPRTSTDW